MKDCIDFEKENIGSLFKKMFFPTLFGMMFTAVFTITDGIFVGRGVGSDALASVNIVAPIFMLSTGIGLMFGMGASVVASIHLSAGKIKTAKINMTQAIITSSLLLILLSGSIMLFPDRVLLLLGCSERLMEPSKAYLYGITPFLMINALVCLCGFFIRLSGAPKYAMQCSGVAALLNVILDYLFIFVFKWGIFGAALATGIGTVVGVVMMLAYLCQSRNLLHIVRMKLSKKSFLLMARNVRYMCILGFSSFLSEMAIACMMLCGNYVFMRYIGEDGVAAFSIACYFSPIVFMLYNSIAQSSQPIISFNYGINERVRVVKARNLSLKVALGCGLGLLLGTVLFSSRIVSLFIDSSATAYAIADNGLPLYALGFIPFAVNVILMSYFQSVEQIKMATFITLMRGFVFMIVCFVILPHIIGIPGAWLAIPFSEMLTLSICLPFFMKRKKEALVRR